MWHGTWYWEPLQTLLADHGFTSIAIDLLPASRYRCGTASKIVADLEFTLTSLDVRGAALVGHSQGGLVVQAFIRDVLPHSPRLLAGAVLMGTMPLGLPPTELVLRALQGHPNMYWGRCGMGLLAYTYFMLTGRVVAGAAKRIFLRPDTDHTDHGGSKAGYLDRVTRAPPDGLLTMNHFVPPSCAQDVRTHEGPEVLVLGAGDDVIYPPAACRSGFETRYPHQVVHAVARGQAHCFVDPGWQESMGKPLLEWLEALEPRVFSTGF
jgi:pimeloyl-ACP methyl ester carboxylesterase